MTRNLKKKTTKKTLKVTHTQAAHIDFDTHVVVLSTGRDLVQQVEVSPRVLRNKKVQ